MLDTLNVLTYNVVSPVNQPFSPAYYSIPMARMYKGQGDGKNGWLVLPASGWTVEYLGTGMYRVHHYQANPSYSVSVTVGPVYATAVVSNMVASSFDVTVNDVYGNPVDGVFAFAVSFIDNGASPTIIYSSPAPQAILSTQVQPLPATIAAVPVLLDIQGASVQLG
jgi:hypothetical protein